MKAATTLELGAVRRKITGLEAKHEADMHIRELTLENFRGAQHLPLDLDKRLNVFVGMNGAGKSTVLDAAAMLLSWLVNRIRNPSASGRHVRESDIKNGQRSASLGIRLVDDGNNLSWQWNIAKVRSGYSRIEAVSTLADVTEAARRMQSGISASEGRINLPLFVYYPVNRAVLDIPLRIREKHRFDLLSAYDESLTSGANFRTFFEWFREREDLENENLRHGVRFAEPEGVSFPDRQLEAVRRALEKFMPDFKNLSVRRNPLRMEVEKHGEVLTVNQLSDGEKCLMAMIGDMARRMAIANPMRDDPLDGEGVILIDEIDLHLHPKWQREVIVNLPRVFPNCQFLISTHSPHIITHVQPESLYLLNMKKDGLECLRPSESYGKTVERVLEDLMGLETTRPEEVGKIFRRIYSQIESGRLKDAKALVEETRERIGNDSELLKADVLIKRKELIGK